jgi:hypothetical protein
MAFVDLLRITVLLAAAAATVLAAVTAIVVGTTGDTLTLFVALGWWIIALVGGLILGRPSQASEAMRPLLAQARTATTMPDIGNPARAALARLWPIGAFAVIAGGLGFVFPGVSAIGAGFALAAALMWRAREGAVAAIEERDGTRFYVEPGSALQPVKLIRTAGLRRERPPPGHPPPPPTAAA